MRKEVTIDTPDNFTIHGTLDSKEKVNKIIIFVHGLTGRKDEHHYFNAVPFFTEKGFDTFRFNLYSRKTNSRALSKSSITTHSSDIRTVLDYFKSTYNDIILIGHSLGALAILKSNMKDVSKIILWDPTSKIDSFEEKNATFCPELDKYILHWGMDIIISKEMIEEWMSIDIPKLLDEIKIPCHTIFAGNDVKHKLWKPYLKNINIESKSIIVDGASHCFIEEGTETKLFDETYNLLK